MERISVNSCVSAGILVHNVFFVPFRFVDLRLSICRCCTWSQALRTARCAIESAATRRVGACPDSFRNLLRILRTQKSPARPRAFRRAGHLISPGPPKSLQNRSKNRSKFWCHFGLVFDASWVPFGLPFGPSWPPKSAQVRPKMPQDRPKTPQEGPKTGQDEHFYAKS